jgi:hypothetical protein
VNKFKMPTLLKLLCGVCIDTDTQVHAGDASGRAAAGRTANIHQSLAVILQHQTASLGAVSCCREGQMA